jgi:uncharacterized protein (DUF885 family)
VNDENIAVANVAIKGKYTQPCVTLKGFEGTISGLITTDVNTSRFYEPYAKKRPAGVSEADFANLAKAAETTIRTVIHPALNKQLAWYSASYKPACAAAPGVSAQPGGAKYYAFRVREETTTSLTAEQIHQIGLSEVARIRAVLGYLSQCSSPSPPQRPVRGCCLQLRAEAAPWPSGLRCSIFERTEDWLCFDSSQLYVDLSCRRISLSR